RHHVGVAGFGRRVALTQLREVDALGTDLLALAHRVTEHRAFTLVGRFHLSFVKLDEARGNGSGQGVSPQSETVNSASRPGVPCGAFRFGCSQLRPTRLSQSWSRLHAKPCHSPVSTTFRRTPAGILSRPAGCSPLPRRNAGP